MPTTTITELREQFDDTVKDATCLNFEDVGAAYRALVAGVTSVPARRAMLTAVVEPLGDGRDRIAEVRSGDIALCGLITGRDATVDDVILGRKLLLHLRVAAEYGDEPVNDVLDQALAAAAYTWNSIGTSRESSLLRLLNRSQLNTFLTGLDIAPAPDLATLTDGHFAFPTDDEWHPMRLRLAKALDQMTWDDMWRKPDVARRIALAVSPNMRHALLVSSRQANPAALMKVFEGDTSPLRFPA